MIFNCERRYIKDGILTIYNENGFFQEYNIKGMLVPVICNHCGDTYDLTAAKVNHRYQDCDQFTTPCCGYDKADTREYKSFPDFKRLPLK